MSAQRLRLDVISNNIANADTTRTPEGGPYRRSRVIFKPRVDEPYFKIPFLPKRLDNGIGSGVKVAEITKDTDAKTRLVYDPTHPDAIQSGPKAGYVEMPNVNIVEEMVGYDFRFQVIRGEYCSGKRVQNHVYAITGHWQIG